MQLEFRFCFPEGLPVSRKTTVILSAVLVLVFFLLLCISLLVQNSRQGMEVRTQRRASQEEILQGGNPLETPGPVMPGERIDINTADAETLQRLPGIGEKLASAIIRYRDANGPFRDPAELQAVEGIGPELVSGISSYITIGDGS